MWVNVQQNTDEWMQLRSGKVTGSSISKVMAHYGKPFGEPAKRLAVEIALTQLTGESENVEQYTNENMQRGHEQEPIARMLYEKENFCNVGNGGFYDNGLTGCSPDGRVEDGLIEIKSVTRFVHYKTIEKNSFDSSYKWQIIFNMKESGASWLDYVSYCSGFPKHNQLFVCRIHPDDFKNEYDQIDRRLHEFKELIEDIKEKIKG